MKWQAIAGVTGQLNDIAKEYLVRKLEKDAAVEAPKVWSEFLSDTTKHLHNSQNFLEVKGNDKTGGLSALMQFDELHQDYHKYHNKPALDYILDKYDERANGYLSSVKNSITRKILQDKIGSYRTSIAGNVADTEIRLVDGKRQSMAIENIEGLKNVTYDNPSLAMANLNDAVTSISSLALSPQAKEKLIHTAKHEISQAAALGLLRQSPESLLSTLKNNKSDWTQFLSLEQRIKLENQASSVIRHKQHLLETQIKSMAPAHLQNILDTGSGLNGFAEHVEKVLSHDSPLYKHIKEEEALHHQAFFVMQRINQADFSEGARILSEFKPAYSQGDNLESSVENYRHFKTQDRLYSLLTKEFDKRQKEAMDDPAMFAEKYNSDIIPNDIPLVQRLILRKNLQQQKGIPAWQVRYLTNNERLSYIERLRNSDPQLLKEEIEGIMSIGKGDYQIGFEVLGELLKDNDKLNPVIYFLAKNSLYKGVSKECADAVTEFSQIAAVHDQLFSSDSDSTKKAVIDAIAANSDLKEWEADMAIGQPWNLKLISHAKQAIKYAARYYMTQGLNEKEAVKKAVSRVIDNFYMRPLDGLQLPKYVTDNGEIHRLNPDFIRDRLLKLRAQLVNGTIGYDSIHTFGQNSQNSPRKITNALASGKWIVTEDGKSLHYTYLTDAGQLQAVMLDSHNPFSVNLLEINTPESEEERLQWFEELKKHLYEQPYF